MKVIGTSDQGYLIAASANEIANLFGWSSTYAEEWKAHLKAEERDSQWASGLIGMEINVGTAYEQLAWLRRRDREFDDLVKSLRKTADMIQDHRPLFDAIVADKPKVA